MRRTLTTEDVVQAAVKPNLVEMCHKGWWSCDHCRHMTHPVQEPDPFEPGESRGVCVHCASPAIHFHKPIF